MAGAAEIDRHRTAHSSRSEKTASGFFLEFYIFSQDFGKKCDSTGFSRQICPRILAFKWHLDFEQLNFEVNKECIDEKRLLSTDSC